MNNMNNIYNMNQMNNFNYQNYNQKEQIKLTRLRKEFQLCDQDDDLMQIGCSFGLYENNISTWRVTMMGPKKTPYEGGIFTIKILFPIDYPSLGPEFKFMNKVYLLNADWRNYDTLGHISLSSLNEWRVTGKVTGKRVYGVKQALFDIFAYFIIKVF